MDYLEIVAVEDGVVHVRCCLTGRFLTVSAHGR